MRCEDVKARLLLYRERALGWRTAAMWLHILRCGACRRRLAELEDSGRKVSEALMSPLDAPDLSDAVMASISTAPARRARPLARLAAGALAAACVIAVIAMVLCQGTAPVVLQRDVRTPSTNPAELPRKGQVARDPGPARREAPHEQRQRVPIGWVQKRHVPCGQWVRQSPRPAKEQPSGPVFVPCPQIVVVYRQSTESPTSAMEMGVTDQATGDTIYYSVRRDSEGNEQSTYMAYKTSTPDKEGT